MRRLLFLFLASCGGGSTEAQPVVHAEAQPAATIAAPTTMQVARPHEAHFTGVILAAYGAMLQTGDVGWEPSGYATRPHTTEEGRAPHSNVAVANVQCRAEDVVGSPFKVTCENGKPSSITDAGEKQFRDRLEACFHTSPVVLPPQVLRAIEGSIHKGSVPLMPARPDTAVPFVSVDVDAHIIEKPTKIAIYEDECKNVPHPCDAVRRRIIGYKPADPNTPSTESRAHTFVGFGPDGYEVLPVGANPGPIFRGIGVATMYAAPMLDGDKPDPRFVVQRYAYPPNAWEPPTKVSPEAVKETYARIVALDPERENDATQLSIFLDRAVLAFAMRDEPAAKRHVHDLDAWLAKHPSALPSEDYAKRAIDTLHLLERGTLSIIDPCER